MITCPFFWVDAFTMGPFSGNPAGVCILTAWPDDDCLQKIAQQNGLAETAFFVALASGKYHLRWFTPAVEIDLCGHATLASAHVLFNELKLAFDRVIFESISGELRVNRLTAGHLALDFPSRPPNAAPLPAELADALGLASNAVVWSGRARDWFIVLAAEADVLALKPDFNALRTLDTEKVIITAPGDHVDFVSRFFAPGAGVNEDPVTGSAQRLWRQPIRCWLRPTRASTCRCSFRRPILVLPR